MKLAALALDYDGTIAQGDALDSAVRGARTLREFVAVLQSANPASLEGYVRHGDFSRWLGEVFGDHALAESLRQLEAGYRPGALAATLLEMIDAIRARYELTMEADAA